MIKIHSLGPLVIEASTGYVPTKANALIVYVASQPGWTVVRPELASLLWFSKDDESGRHSLRNMLVEARKRFGKDVFLPSHSHVSLSKDHVWFDGDQFEALAASERMEDLIEACDLYRGEFLSDVDSYSDPWEEWLQCERNHRRDQIISVTSRLGKMASKGGKHSLAISTCKRMVAFDPLCEVSHRQMIWTYRRAGRNSDAVRFFRECKTLLRRELDVEPDPMTIAVMNEVVGT